MASLIAQRDIKRQNTALKEIKNCSQEDLAQFEARFKDFIQPIYGDQSIFLEKIFKCLDRNALLLFEENNLVGIGVFKNELSNEYAKYNIKDGLEIKTFLVFPESRLLYGYYSSIIFNRIAQEAMNLNGRCLFGTVSEMKKKHLSFFNKMGFHKVKIFSNFKKSGKEECLICNPSPINLWELTDTFIQKYEIKRMKD